MYEDKDELIYAIWRAYVSYISEFSDIPESDRDLRKENCDRTPFENLAYQAGWLRELVLWERSERINGLDSVDIPSTRQQRGEEVELFYRAYSDKTLEEIAAELDVSVKLICQSVKSMSSDTLFEPGRREWTRRLTGGRDVPAAKIVHNIAVSHFGTMRTKVRRWKKAAPVRGNDAPEFC